MPFSTLAKPVLFSFSCADTWLAKLWTEGYCECLAVDEWCISTSSLRRFIGHQRLVGRKNLNPRGQEGKHMVPSGRHMAAEQITAVVVPAQHMYKIKPIKIPAHIGNGLLRFCPLCSSYWWVIILRERSYCLLGLRLLVGCPYLCGMVNTSWVLRVNNNDNKKK